MKHLIALIAFMTAAACAPADRHDASALDAQRQPAASTINVPATFLDASDLDVASASGGDFLAMELPFGPAHAAKLQLDAFLGKKLKDRGEAHITLVTPPEHAVLAPFVKHAEMLALAADMNLQASTYETPCVGRGTLGTGANRLETYYIVINDDALLAYREKLASLFVARGGKAGKFKAALFNPHATLGFTKRDLFLEDGVVKDEASCIVPIQITP